VTASRPDQALDVLMRRHCFSGKGGTVTIQMSPLGASARVVRQMTKALAGNFARFARLAGKTVDGAHMRTATQEQGRSSPPRSRSLRTP
jgi:hypothetical protein